MTEKMTTLDALSCMDVNADILLIRATYWETVAERHYRANRAAQADRLMIAAKKMRTEAKLLIRADKEAARAAKIAAAAPAPTKKSRKTAPTPDVATA